MSSISSALLLFQSLTLTFFGAITLTSPASAGSDDLPSQVNLVLGSTALSLGIAYIVTAFQSRRSRHWFLLAATPLRILSGGLFWKDGQSGTAIWDVGNGLLNLAIVVWERWS